MAQAAKTSAAPIGMVPDRLQMASIPSPMAYAPRPTSTTCAATRQFTSAPRAMLAHTVREMYEAMGATPPPHVVEALDVL
jgi:hypothetical protein